MWKNVNHNQINDIYHYILTEKVKRNGKIHIGTDSIVIGKNIYYILAIAFRDGKNGAHFIYQKTKMETYRNANGKPDIFTRLWQEGRMTIDFAQELINRRIVIYDELVLEFDYNNIRETISKPLIPSIVGWAKGLEFQNIMLKSDSQIAVKAANQICQTC
jgi:predicted RNase H-related nuclease YkuK (DUF458 family)